MDLSTLKQKIRNKEAIQDLIIFVCPENTFIAKQYVDAIKASFLGEIRAINSLSEISEGILSLAADDVEYLNILNVDEFAEIYKSYTNFTNTIVICNKVQDKVKKLAADYIITINKLQDWQIIDYCQAKCPGLSKASIEWLYNNANGDIYKIDSELDKVALYEAAEQENIFNQIKAESDLFHYNLFTLESALVKKDYDYIKACLRHINDISQDGMALVSILTAKYKKITLLCYKPALTPEEVGISSGEAYHIRNLNVPMNVAQHCLTFLSSLDGRLKNGELEMSPEAFLSYVIMNVIY